MMTRSDPTAEAEEYGPGTDLVISMFAVAILILGIFGIGNQLRPVVVPLPDEPVVDIAPPEPEPLPPIVEEPPFPPDDQVLLSKAEYDAFKAFQAQQEEEEKPAPPKPLPPPGVAQAIHDLVVDERDRLQLDKDELEGNQERLLDQLSLADKAFKALQIRYDELKNSRSDEGVAIVNVTEKDIGALFVDGGRRPSLNLLRQMKLDFRRYVSGRPEGDLNAILVETHSSFDQVVTKNGTDSALFESTIWALTLQKALREGGVASSCITIRPMGRARSTLIVNQISRHKGSTVYEKFDELMQDEDHAKRMRESNADRIAGERRVTIRGIYDPASTCPKDVVLKGLASFAER